MAPRRPTAVAFDVNETLFGLEPLRARLTELGLPESALEWWFAVVLREGFALAAAGDDRPFGEVAAAGLAEVLAARGIDAKPDVAERVLSGFDEMVPHPDVRPALSALAAAGIPALCLTNGSAQVVQRLVDQADLGPLVSEVLSVADAGHWKPRPEPYRYAAGVAGVPAEALALVAVHPWDVHGAARAGLVAAWANRTGRAFPGIFVPPDVEGRDLVDVVGALLALPER
ncbi:MAG: haloacid dehalogenase type II [Acidimicrobiales bacterium]